ncbi:MAG: tetratricopeptide repeat protein [Symploca sp. SIO2C1]|nr:tetratricopeptide repeat protein [Symploca sp. SIO2C1]
MFPFVGLARFYQGQGDYEQTVNWYEQCYLATKTRLGNEHPHVATSVNHLAHIYKLQGRYD